MVNNWFGFGFAAFNWKPVTRVLISPPVWGTIVIEHFEHFYNKRALKKKLTMEKLYLQGLYYAYTWKCHISTLLCCNWNSLECYQSRICLPVDTNGQDLLCLDNGRWELAHGAAHHFTLFQNRSSFSLLFMCEIMPHFNVQTFYYPVILNPYYTLCKWCQDLQYPTWTVIATLLLVVK